MKSNPLPKVARILLTFLCTAVCVLFIYVELFLFAFAFDDRVTFVFCVPCFVIGIAFIASIVFVFLWMNKKGWYIKNIGNAIIGVTSFYFIMIIIGEFLSLNETRTYWDSLFSISATITPLFLLTYTICHAVSTVIKRNRESLTKLR